MPSDVQSSYDRLAKTYAAHIYGELAHKPFDRKMLDWLIEKVGGQGMICDMGCGPGQVARYLKDHGPEACGIDLSPEMTQEASRLNPDIAFQQGDMLALTGVADGAVGGIAAFYSIIHIPRDQTIQSLTELKRTLRPGGSLLLTFHIGQETRHIEELWGVDQLMLDFLFFETMTMKTNLQAAGFTLEEVIERDPYPPEIEVQTRRAYIFARK